MNFFKIKMTVLLGIGFASLALGLYMAAFGQTPPTAGHPPFLILEDIDRLMGVYPFALGLYLCFKAKWYYEDNAHIEL